MKLSIRNGFAVAAGIATFLITLGSIGRYWSETLIPACIYIGQPLWQLLLYPLVPLVAGSLLAGVAFALVSSEAARPAAIIVGAIVVISPTVPAYMTFSFWPVWWYPMAWAIVILAALPGVLAVRGLQSWVYKRRVSHLTAA